jgi:RimJ/RimL family protein N-acetyltransferase
MIISTPRLRLRCWSHADRPVFAALHADPEVMHDYGGPISRAKSDAKLARYMAIYHQHGFSRWAVETLAGEFVGYAGIMPDGPDHPLGLHVQIGWRLMRHAWGRGYATEAARAALIDAFDRVGLDEVIAYTAADNLRSQAVMARLRMHRDSARDFTMDYAANKGWCGLVWKATHGGNALYARDDITSFVTAQPEMMKVLAAVEALGLPDCWVGAGFVRNPVWDALHGRPWSASYTDIDVVYFDPTDIDPKRDEVIEAELRVTNADMPWSVKNQARMHVQNGDPPYADTADAMRHWPETCTAIAVRSVGSTVELLALFGVDDLLNMIVRPTPAFANKLEIYRARLARKAWSLSWPMVREMGLP